MVGSFDIQKGTVCAALCQRCVGCTSSSIPCMVPAICQRCDGLSSRRPELGPQDSTAGNSPSSTASRSVPSTDTDRAFRFVKCGCGLTNLPTVPQLMHPSGGYGSLRI
jgi:hypothetical protein